MIQNFSIPNTKEDMLEFMILATSNVNLKAFDAFNPPKASEKALTDAWASKAKQVYEKARLSYGSEQDFHQIQALYENLNEDIKKARRTSNRKIALVFGGILGALPALGLLIFLIGLLFGPGAAKKENARLEAIEETATIALENGEYKKALLNAEALIYSPSVEQSDTDKIARQWDIKRELLIEKILVEASANGVSLERTAPETTEPPEGDPFEEGFKEGIQPGLDAFNEAFGNKNEDTSSENGQEPVEIAGPGAEPDSSSIAGTNSESEVVGHTEPDIDLSANSVLTIEQGAEYAFMDDQWHVYIARAVTDSIISIELWDKQMNTSDKVKLKANVGTYKINDADNEFNWIDDTHLAFSFSFSDPERVNLLMKPKEFESVIFTIDSNTGNVNKGSNYEKRIRCFSFQTDDWHKYRIIPLNSEKMKIECWYRGSSLRNFIYGYDVGIIESGDQTIGFEWTDNEKTAFIIILQDSENSETKKPALTVFTLENKEYKFDDVQSFLENK